MNGIDAARLLRETDLFAGIDDQAADQLAKRAVTRHYSKGQHLFHQGDAGDTLFVVVDGRVAVVVCSENGDRMVLTTLHAHDTLGEIALLDGGVRSASAEALEDTTVLLLARPALLDLVRDSPALAEQLLRSLGRLVRRLSEQAADFVFLDLPGRIAKALLRLAEETDGASARLDLPVEISVTQGRLAEMVGGSRQSVNQILQNFQQRGLVDLNGRRLVVSRFDLLRKRASG